MASNRSCCVVCGPDASQVRARRVVVAGHDVFLCSSHASIVRRAKPATFDELRELFKPEGSERRSAIPRRDNAGEDRRMFPPRPEGRRRGAGRRATDPHE